MPKFLSYQRPTPVNKLSWVGRQSHGQNPVPRPVPKPLKTDKGGLALPPLSRPGPKH
jgi:hypothetical protein